MQQSHHLDDGGRPFRRQGHGGGEGVDEPVLLGMELPVGGDEFKGNGQGRFPLRNRQGLHRPKNERLSSMLPPEQQQTIDQGRHGRLCH